MGRPKTKKPLRKKVQAINFDIIVLDKLEAQSKAGHISMSELVNKICKGLLVTDEVFYKEMAKDAAMRLAEYQFLAKRAREMKNEVL